MKKEKTAVKRQKGTGSIFKIGKTYYYKNVKAGIDRVSLRTAKESEARKIVETEYMPIVLAQSKEEIAAHVAVARKLQKKKRVKLDKAWSLYLENPTRPQSSGATLEDYERRWNSFLRWLAANYPHVSSLEQIDEDITQKFALYDWGTGISANTYNNHIQACRLITRILQRDTGIDINPWNCIARKKENKQSRREFTESEVWKILDSFKSDELKIVNRSEMRVMFNLGAWTGLRLIDCALMKWASIDLKKNKLHCKPIKTSNVTNTTVTIPLHPHLSKELKLAVKWKRNEYVLPQIAERYRNSPTGLKKDAVKVLEKAGFETSVKVENIQRKQKANVYGFHSFRHSFVSFCANAGVPLPVVQSIVGHGNPAITRHYVHIGEESIQRAINALPGQGDKSDSDRERIEKVIKILKSKKKLTKTERDIISILYS